MKALRNMVRTTFTDTDGADLKHEHKVDRDSNVKMANAKKSWLMDYQEEREKKREYIRQHVVAQGLDESKLLKKMQDLKSSVIPSIDDFDHIEIRNLVEELQHEYEMAKEGEGDQQIDSSGKTGENGGSGDNSDAKSSMALFDKLQAKEDQELDDSVSSVRSSNSFRSVGTRKAKLTVLNQKACAQIYVSDVYQLITSKIGKMVRAQSLMIVMTAYPMGWKVQRLDIDFVQLRNYLIRKYPQVIIPPLPLVNQKKKLSRKQLAKKKIYYQKFMSSVMKSKVLRGCKFLVDFLREQDQYKFGYDLSVKEQSRGPRRVKQIKTLTGEVLCEASDMAKQFAEDFNAFNAEYQRINNQVSKRCKQVEIYAKKLAYQYFSLSTELDNLQKLVLQKTEIPQFSNLYQRISDMVRMTGELSIHQGFMVNDALNAQFKYQREQGRTSFQEAFLLVQGSEFKFIRAQKLLEQEKYKLFKKQDYEQWEVQDPALIKELYKVRNNYEEAKHLMLPQRTQQVQELLDESQYFKQQLFNEVRRIIMLDYFSSRENFLEVGEQYVNHMGKNIKQWHQFICFYSDINNARKEKDELYKREQYVGEELDWKMLADNLTMFESQMEDLKDLRGFEDADNSMMMNQSIVVHTNNQGGVGMSGQANIEDPFQADNISMVAGYRPNQRQQQNQGPQYGRSQSLTGQTAPQRSGSMHYPSNPEQQQQNNDDFRPHPGMQNNQNNNMFDRFDRNSMPMQSQGHRNSMSQPRTQGLNNDGMNEPLLSNQRQMMHNNQQQSNNTGGNQGYQQPMMTQVNNQNNMMGGNFNNQQYQQQNNFDNNDFRGHPNMQNQMQNQNMSQQQWQSNNDNFMNQNNNMGGNQNYGNYGQQQQMQNNNFQQNQFQNQNMNQMNQMNNQMQQPMNDGQNNNMDAQQQQQQQPEATGQLQEPQQPAVEDAPQVEAQKEPTSPEQPAQQQQPPAAEAQQPPSTTTDVQAETAVDTGNSQPAEDPPAAGDTGDQQKEEESSKNNDQEAAKDE